MAFRTISKIRPGSAAAPAPITPSEVTARIRQTLGGLAIPHTRVCEPGDALETLCCAQDVMELLAALDDFRNGVVPFEMPERGPFAIAIIRQMAQDAVKYAADLCGAKDNLRGAFDSGRMGTVAAFEVANA